MPDGAVFSGRIHRPKDQKDRMAVGRMEKLAAANSVLNILPENFLVLLLRFVHRIDHGRTIIKADLLSRAYTKFVRA